MSELKPCPHCGEANELYPEMRDMGRSGPFAIDCLGCGADFVPREGRDVVAAWNRRDETAISQARAEGRREGLEEASRKATSFLVGDPRKGIPLRSPMPHEIAFAILALSQKEGGKDG